MRAKYLHGVTIALLALTLSGVVGANQSVQAKPKSQELFPNEVIIGDSLVSAKFNDAFSEAFHGTGNITVFRDAHLPSTIGHENRGKNVLRTIEDYLRGCTDIYPELQSPTENTTASHDGWTATVWNTSCTGVPIRQSVVDPVSVCKSRNIEVRNGSVIATSLQTRPSIDKTELGSLVENFDAVTMGSPNANLYIKRAGMSSLDLHRDSYDVLITQIAGTNNWTLCAPLTTGNSSHTSSALTWTFNNLNMNAGPVLLNKHKLQCTTVLTRPGDALLIPRLVPHSAVAVGGASIHLTFGFVGTAKTWAHVINATFRKHLDTSVKKKLQSQLQSKARVDESWHRSVPLSLNAEHVHAEVKTHLTDFCQNMEEACGYFTTSTIRDAVADSLVAHGTIHSRVARQAVVRGCTIGTQSARFRCPSGDEHDKTLLDHAGGISCSCDGWFGTSCGCDGQSPNYGRCTTDCSQCSCPRGMRLDGCSSASFYAAGTCVVNDVGDYCNEQSSVNVFCSGGLTCLGSRCCNGRVHTENCLACAGTTGFCTSWRPGYAGSYADRCTTPGYYLEVDTGLCLAVTQVGDCTTGRECQSGTCKGGRCCSPTAGNNVRCTTCGTNGECIACNAAGLSPTFTCTTCEPGYYSQNSTAGQFTTCYSLEHPGRTCSNSANCLSSDCRGGRCCAPGMPTHTNTTCSSCGVTGQCDQCMPGYTLHQGECVLPCSDMNGTSVVHGGAERRTMFSGLPADGQVCDQLAQDQTRTCFNGTWSAWTAVNSATGLVNQFPLSQCNERCRLIPELGMHICFSNQTVDPQEVLAGNIPHCPPYGLASVPYDATVTTLRYAQAEVGVGQPCSSQVVVLTCSSGGRLEALVNASSVTYPYSTCRARCSANCSISQEFNTTHCDAGCNVADCDYQHGTCGALLGEALVSAKTTYLLNVARETTINVNQFSSLCSLSAAQDPVQQATIEAACTFDANLKAGLGLNGRNSSFIFPLSLQDYTTQFLNMIARFRHLETLRATAQQSVVQERQLKQIMHDFTARYMMQLNGLAGNISGGLNNIDVVLNGLSSQQREHFHLLTQQFAGLENSGRQLFTQLISTHASLLQSDLNTVNTLTSQNAQHFADLDAHLSEGFGGVFGVLEDMSRDIADNRVLLEEINHHVRILMSTGLGLEDQLSKVTTNYYVRSEALPGAANNAELLNVRFSMANSTGFDSVVPDGLIDATELVAMMNDFGILNPYAALFLEISAELDQAGANATVDDLVNMLILRGDPRARMWVQRQTTLLRVDESVADVDGNGAIDLAEALSVLRDSHGLFGSAEGFFDAWTGHTNGTRHRRFLQPSRWADFARDSLDTFAVTLVNESKTIGRKAVADISKELTGLMDGVSLIGRALASTLPTCFNFLRAAFGVILAPFTGGTSLALLAQTVIEAVNEAVKCAEGVNQLVSQVAGTFRQTSDRIARLGQIVQRVNPLVGDWVQQMARRAGVDAVTEAARQHFSNLTSAQETVNAISSARQAVSRAVERISVLADDTRVDILNISNTDLTGYRANSTFPYSMTSTERLGMLSAVRQALTSDFTNEIFHVNRVQAFNTTTSTSTSTTTTFTTTPTEIGHASVPTGDNNLFVATADQFVRVLNDIDGELSSQAALVAGEQALRLYVNATSVAANTSQITYPAQTLVQLLDREVQEMQETMLSWVAKLRKQIEAATFQTPTFGLAGLSSNDFSDWLTRAQTFVTRYQEDAARTMQTSHTVEYTFYCADHPEQCRRLGQNTSFRLTATNQTVVSPTYAEFYLAPPTISDSSHMVYSDIMVTILGPGGVRISPDRITSIIIIKGSESIFFQSDGLLENALRFEHGEVSYRVRYHSTDCTSASAHVLPHGHMLYSPYGSWRIAVESTMDVTAEQVQLQFVTRQRHVPTVSGTLPLFADDFTYPYSSSIVHPFNSSGCQLSVRHAQFMPTAAPSTAAPTPVAITLSPSNIVDASEASGSSSEVGSTSLIAILAAVGLLIIVAGLMALILRRRKDRNKEGLTMTGATWDASLTGLSQQPACKDRPVYSNPVYSSEA